MPIPVTKPTRADMLKCVARFRDLYRADHSLPDCEVSGYERTLINVIGFAAVSYTHLRLPTIYSV